MDGICIYGNILVDIVKTVDCYPKMGMLANISKMSRAVGGSVPNTGIDLAKMDPALPLSAMGRVGTDAEGDYVLGELARYGINTDRVVRDSEMPTGFSDVMSQPSGERTFFHMRGANDRFSPADIDLDTLNCRMLHFGYIMLMDAFDQPDSEYGTVLAHFLHDAQARGIKTSVDAVSSGTADYRATVTPALRYSDYVIINEIESCGIWGLDPRNTDGTLNVATVREAMERIAESGVREKVIVHSKEAGLCLDVPTGRFTAQPAVDIPRDSIVGSVGAGDAFCAGCLYGIYNGFDDDTLLGYASAAAVCNLTHENSVDGMKDKDTVMEIARNTPRLPIKL